jgi:hypothetical protein
VVGYPEFSHHKNFLGEEIEIQPASEPSDIIWECRYITERTRQIKKVIVFIIIMSLLLISFFIIFVSQKNALALKNKYPPSRCGDTETQYEDMFDKWERNAIIEYKENFEF